MLYAINKLTQFALLSLVVVAVLRSTDMRIDLAMEFGVLVALAIWRMIDDYREIMR